MARSRVRKTWLITALKAKALAHKLTSEQVETFELLYRRARTPQEQDEVTRALDLQIHGWKTNTDAFSRVLQSASNMGELADDEEE